MRVLLDGNLPAALGGLLVGHEVHTIHERRWSDLDNGVLLTSAAGEYDAFITMDQSLRYQQNLSGRDIAVVVVRAQSNRIEDLEPLVAPILESLPLAPRGAATILGA